MNVRSSSGEARTLAADWAEFEPQRSEDSLFDAPAARDRAERKRKPTHQKQSFALTPSGLGRAGASRKRLAVGLRLGAG